MGPTLSRPERVKYFARQQVAELDRLPRTRQKLIQLRHEHNNSIIPGDYLCDDPGIVGAQVLYCKTVCLAPVSGGSIDSALCIRRYDNLVDVLVLCGHVHAEACAEDPWTPSHPADKFEDVPPVCSLFSKYDWKWLEWNQQVHYADGFKADV
jgi:hypothetical protein